MKLMKNNKIIIGLLICLFMVSVGAQAAEASWRYTVRSGDSFWKIAQRYGTTVNEIKAASGYWSNTLHVGQVLTIPTGGQASTQSYSTATSGRISAANRTLLARVVEAEATAEPYTGKVAVAAVLLNRVESSQFSNTVQGVVYQKNAFETVSNNRIWQVTPTQETYKAVDQAINGWDPANQALFFWNPAKVSSTSWVWTRTIVARYGGHVFAK